jgi:hypothetical protein
MALHAKGFGDFHDPPSGPASGRVFVLKASGLDVDASGLDSRPTEAHTQPQANSADPAHADRARREETFFSELEGDPR